MSLYRRASYHTDLVLNSKTQTQVYNRKREGGSMLSFKQQITQSILQNPFLCTLISTILICFLMKRRQPTPTAKKTLPPSPAKIPILGNLHQIGTLPHRSLQSLAKKHGPLMLLHFGKVPTLVVSSPDAAREIMKTHDVIFANRPESSVMKRLLYDMKDLAVAPYGEYWRQLKSIFVLQLLSNKRVQSFCAIREEETALMMEKIKESCISSSPLNLSDLFMAITNDIVCRSAFGRKYRDGAIGEKFLELISEFLGLLGSINVGEFIPWLAWINRVNGFDARVDYVAKELDEFLEGVIEEHLKNGVENPSGKDESKENFVDILLRIYKDNNTGVSIDRDSIKSIILDVFSAGTDTTSTVLEWGMTELLRHPIVMKKLQNEVRGILNGKQDVTDADLEKMHYLKAVVKETLRYHTPIPLLVAREARKDVNVMGYDIAAGTMVMTNAWAIGRDPIYWDEPEKFQPEKFLNSSIDIKGLDFQLIPFGAGRRGCPGISFAMATNELVLANIIQKFDWELPNGAKGEDLDMSERPGVSVHRKVPLMAVATKCYF
ncbi:cytochrome P450 71A8-like [Olea europaea var. sylvestris]|uniref:cytochrome P450 71A8-like n=1 Tax=Olea europaea var. sylvestris TaxID=158386 RepID=UPI000C1D7024|nr:cytochrome P450 71A8-like [Olea europaea var. sylvestris]